MSDDHPSAVAGVPENYSGTLTPGTEEVTRAECAYTCLGVGWWGVRIRAWAEEFWGDGKRPARPSRRLARLCCQPEHMCESCQPQGPQGRGMIITLSDGPPPSRRVTNTASRKVTMWYNAEYSSLGQGGGGGMIIGSGPGSEPGAKPLLRGGGGEGREAARQWPGDRPARGAAEPGARVLVAGMPRHHPGSPGRHPLG